MMRQWARDWGQSALYRLHLLPLIAYVLSQNRVPQGNMRRNFVVFG
jgi:hypothetical protein